MSKTEVEIIHLDMEKLSKRKKTRHIWLQKMMDGCPFYFLLLLLTTYYGCIGANIVAFLLALLPYIYHLFLWLFIYQRNNFL